ncbi:MAG: DUF167 domain-containing protein [Tabrizicola flagellatus]|uniref:DUF167 domain-containing protein n=1 Tax=Tabrizicola flagellatus TaxID=2593021 RepID=UPI00391BC3B9
MNDLSDLARDGAIFPVRVTPNARCPGVERVGDRIAIKVSEPPEDGRATEAARVSLAQALGVAKSRLKLVRGATSREKLFRLD